MHRPVTTGPQHPHFRHARAQWRGVNAEIGVVFGEAASLAHKPRRILEELRQHLHLLGEHFKRIGLGAGHQGCRRARVGARRAAEAEIDAAGIQRLEHAEDFRHLER